MQLAKYALLAAAIAAANVVGSNHVDAPRHKQQLKIPDIWKSPLFKSSGGFPGLGPLSGPSPHPNGAPSPITSKPNTTSLQENFQIHEPAPILTTPIHSCSVTLVERSFGNSYGSPSSLAFDPLSAFAGTACADPAAWTGLTLDVHGETRGRQFDRLGTVWVGNNHTGQGVEVLRLDNPEPTRAGVFWDISKDVGKYWPLFSQQADVVFDLPNIVDSTYAGALNVTLKLTASVQGVVSRRGVKRRGAVERGSHAFAPSTALPLKQRAADVVIPLSKRLQTDNTVFLLGGSAGNGTTSVRIPSNAARALVEVYASGTSSEEFWFTGIPDQFYTQIPDAASDGYYGHGTYREVQLYIDGRFAGYVTPYAVIFTGGINPLLWRPSANYGTFDQPTYTIDITPWLGALTDGAEHVFELAVVSSEVGGAINDASWFVSGNVQVYVDASGKRTTGRVVWVQEGAERVDGYTAGVLDGDPLGNGTLRYEVGLKRGRTFGVAGSVRTGSGVEYVAGWYQSSEYSNKGFVNATAQTNDQKSFGWTRLLVLDADTVDAAMSADLAFDSLPPTGASAVQLDFNYPLSVASTLSNTSFDAQVTQHFDRSVRRTASHPGSGHDLDSMVGDECTFVHVRPVAALPHTTLSSRREQAESVLENGAIASGSGTAWQSFMYRDMAGGTIDRETRTNTSSVLEDRLGGSVRGRAQPKQLSVG
ncbi:related to peptide-n4-(n-acetyl-beta-glucosaminyl) asparagine amidase [Sporisorium reilianum SRZ2]|uniref:Related to peptide-n4-(N-acetyl-beta-glucosaminyl) asparagine amidase n=1 Tax=Sporisorium reilianum (strain SRZ2) TaxID=999809 RepID=E6ZUP7_SPORE|nr:related to peptide-n4-(n-acetyl-beta-glucosaminyl) asparagine amidase [Sporisorium reilianum SRZ2]